MRMATPERCPNGISAPDGDTPRVMQTHHSAEPALDDTDSG